jgi:hypothetical protein
MKRLVAVDLFIGKDVVDVYGAHAGRIEEIVVEGEPNDCRVVEYHLGSYALRERLGLGHIFPFASVFGLRRLHRTIVPWRNMDLSAPEHPRLTCRVDELPRRPTRHR